MKAINVTFEDSEIKNLEEMKADRSWRKFILDMFNELNKPDGREK